MTFLETHHFVDGEEMPKVDPNKITLLNMRFCPFAERTALVLIAKRIPFDNINVNLKKKPKWFTEGTFGKVPVLLFKGKKIPESLITADFLEDVSSPIILIITF